MKTSSDIDLHFLGDFGLIVLATLAVLCVIFIYYLLTRLPPEAMNDSDSQAKRIMLWQEAMREMSSEERRMIETDPAGWKADETSALVEVRLRNWQEKRQRE